MSAGVDSGSRTEALEWMPLLFVKYKEGKKTHTADVRGPEWTASPANALGVLPTFFQDQKRLWNERRIDLGLQDGAPVWLRIVREYEGGDIGTSFIPWPDVVALEYKGEILAQDDPVLPFSR